jgi:NAD(P)-dependent dehydrogenase (short-subunit alcohol dehydrogenase family)
MSNKWTENNIPDQTGRVVIVTGANTGIGFEAAKYLAQKNAKVIMACRSMAKGEAARDKIKSALPNVDLEVMALDLSRQVSVKEFVVEFLAKHERLDLLINNAGVMMCPFERTEDGWELQFATNHLGHYTLTMLLLPKLLERDDSRIVNVSSLAANMGKMDFNDAVYAEKEYKEMEAYSQSKLANVLFTWELQKRLGAAERGTMVTAAHPGWTATDLQRHSGMFRLLNPFIAMKPAMGALPTVRAAVDSSLTGGEFIGPTGMGNMRGYPQVIDYMKWRNAGEFTESNQARLWELSELLTGISYEI